MRKKFGIKVIVGVVIVTGMIFVFEKPRDVLVAYAQSVLEGDVNGDDVVDVFDLNAVVSNYGEISGLDGGVGAEAIAPRIVLGKVDGTSGAVEGEPGETVDVLLSVFYDETEMQINNFQGTLLTDLVRVAPTSENNYDLGYEELTACVGTTWRSCRVTAFVPGYTAIQSTYFHILASVQSVVYNDFIIYHYIVPSNALVGDEYPIDLTIQGIYDVNNIDHQGEFELVSALISVVAPGAPTSTPVPPSPTPDPPTVTPVPPTATPIPPTPTLTTAVGSQVVLNSETNLSCDTLCANIGKVCTNIGTDTLALNGKFNNSTARGCLGITIPTAQSGCASLMRPTGALDWLCEGYKTDWTNCSCQ